MMSLRLRPSSQRAHDPVGLVERLGDYGLDPAQLGEHAGVLGALSGVEEGHLGRGARAAEDAAAAQRLPGGRVPGRKCLQRLAGLLCKLGRVAVVDRDPLGLPQRGLLRQGRRWRVTRGGRGLHVAQPGLETGVVIGADHERAARRRQRLAGGCARGHRGYLRGHRYLRASLSAVLSWHVFLHYRVEVCSAKAEGAHAGHAGVAAGGFPIAQLRVDRKGRGGPVHVRVRPARSSGSAAGPSRAGRGSSSGCPRRPPRP